MSRFSHQLGSTTEKGRAFRHLQGTYKVKELEVIKNALKDGTIESGEISQKLLDKMRKSGDSALLEQFGTPGVKSGSSTSPSSSASTSSSLRRQESVSFHRVDDVFMYLGNHTFKNDDGFILSIRPSGISVTSGGRTRQVTNAVSVSLNNESSATVTANSPYDGKHTFLVNCSTRQIVEMGSSRNNHYYEQ